MLWPELTMMIEIEQIREISCGTTSMARVGQSGARISQLIEEGMYHGVDGGQALRWRVLK